MHKAAAGSIRIHLRQIESGNYAGDRCHVPTIEEVLSGRADYSTFLVHLTRAQGLKPAREVLHEILEQRCLAAIRPHCLFGPILNNFDDDDRKHFNVACFTEAPLHQIGLFIGPIEGRGVELEPYGLVFTKEFIGTKGGNPALYINTYHQDELKNAALDLFGKAHEDGFEDSSITRLLPFVNIFGKTATGGTYDFHWEREWRVVGDVEFTWSDVVVGLCPEGEIEEFADEFPAVPFICPFWGLDRIITHLRESA